MSVEIVTFGCRLNTYESEAIRREAVAAGIDDAIIVNGIAPVTFTNAGGGTRSGGSSANGRSKALW